MLRREFCQQCIASIPTEERKKVHRLLDSSWTRTRDEWFWLAQKQVRCYYGDNGPEDRSIDSDPPRRCPFKMESVVLDQDKMINEKNEKKQSNTTIT